MENPVLVSAQQVLDAINEGIPLVPGEASVAGVLASMKQGNFNFYLYVIIIHFTNLMFFKLRFGPSKRKTRWRSPGCVHLGKRSNRIALLPNSLSINNCP